MIEAGWREVQLGELLTIKHGFAFRGEFFRDSGDLIVLTPGNFNEGGGFKPKSGTEKFYDGPVPKGYLLKAGQVVVALTEQAAGLLGSSAIVPIDDVYLHNQRIGLVETRPETAEARYLYYLFNTPGVRLQIASTATGAKVRHTAPERIHSVRVRIPSLAKQNRIADVLGSFDALIQNNARRVAVLEEAMRALYREWTHEQSLHGRSTASPLDSFCESVTASVDPNGIDPGMPAVGLEHLPRRSTTLTDWARAETLGSRKLRFEPGDVLFGKIRPYFHKVVFSPISGICSTDAIVLRPTRPSLGGAVLAIASSDEFVAHAVQTSNGTKMPRADWKVLRRYSVPFSDCPATEEFSGRVLALLQAASTLGLENRALSTARDLLVPRLVTGLVDVDSLAVEDVYGWTEAVEA